MRSHYSGFEVRDAIALMRLDDLFIESFEIKDVKVDVHQTVLAHFLTRSSAVDTSR